MILWISSFNFFFLRTQVKRYKAKMFLFPAMDVENQNCSGDFFHLGRRNQKTTNTKTNTYRNTKTNTNYFFFTWDGGTRKIQIQKQRQIETQKPIQIIFSPGKEGPEDWAAQENFASTRNVELKKLCLMKMKTKKYILCKKATCEVRKSTLHLNLPTSLSSTEEISRNAVGGDDDRGRDHDVGDDDRWQP